VSNGDSTAFDRALQLAKRMTVNGINMNSFSCKMSVNPAFAAPLALRAAKMAISRSEDLSLETGMRLSVLFTLECITWHCYP
jgi:enoyl-CoA hydratase/carnithine racemase